jgi:glycosyltransferase involved in cell wall biosynthesis
MLAASIVIRTKNEGRHLGRCLAQVHRQASGPLEVIVVDSGSTDDTLAIASGFSTRVLTIPPAAFTYGHALNVGFAAARAPVVVSLSGHAIPRDAQWLAELLRPFADPRVAGAYSRQVPHPGSPAYERLFVHAFPGHPARLGSLSDLMFNNAAAAARRERWAEIPFDAGLPACEDHAWLLDQRARGFRVRYAPASVVVHSHAESFARFLRRRLAECRGLEQLYAARGRPLPAPLLAAVDRLERWTIARERAAGRTRGRPPAALACRTDSTKHSERTDSTL